MQDCQFGFRPKHSTNIAIAYLINKIVSAHEKNKLTLGLFIDLKKAFDTVNHNILLSKLEHYGIRGIPLKGITNYLQDREQYVCFNNVKSISGNVSCGVPQGSILGPLLFLIYINDLCQISNILETVLYADDTSLFLSGSNIDDMITSMNSELKKLITWLNANKLTC